MKSALNAKRFKPLQTIDVSKQSFYFNLIPIRFVFRSRVISNTAQVRSVDKIMPYSIARVTQSNGSHPSRGQWVQSGFLRQYIFPVCTIKA